MKTSEQIIVSLEKICLIRLKPHKINLHGFSFLDC